MISIWIFVGMLIVRVESVVNLSDTKCGLGGAMRNARIVGGVDAAPQQFPWLVSLTRRGGHFCGGTVLNKRWIITAGHCLCGGTGKFISPQQIKIQIGMHDIKNRDASSQEMSIGSITLHPEYSCTKAIHDIALLYLTEDIVWSDFVQPACLPHGLGNPEYTRFEEVKAVVAGWGWLNENTEGGRTNVLQMVEVGVVENDQCNNWYRSQGKKTQIKNTQMCAGIEAGGKDACWADSGGPLMISRNDQMVVIGVVSTGIGCARPKLPGLYTRTSDYMSWIQSVLQN